MRFTVPLLLLLLSFIVLQLYLILEQSDIQWHVLELRWCCERSCLHASTPVICSKRCMSLCSFFCHVCLLLQWHAYGAMLEGTVADHPRRLCGKARAPNRCALRCTALHCYQKSCPGLDACAHTYMCLYQSCVMAAVNDERRTTVQGAWFVQWLCSSYSIPLCAGCLAELIVSQSHAIVLGQHSSSSLHNSCNSNAGYTSHGIPAKQILLAASLAYVGGVLRCAQCSDQTPTSWLQPQL
jgi:hypothetical protein